MKTLALSIILLDASMLYAAVPTEIFPFPGSDYFPNGLVQGTNGNFYGTMHQNGQLGYGAIFELCTNGTVINLFVFSGTNGANPKSRLTLGTDGNFYGVTQTGGASGDGTVFQMTPSGQFTNLCQFSSSSGSYPFGELMQGMDGGFYGTTESANNVGTVFRVTSSGAVTTVATFTSVNGNTPWAGLVQDKAVIFMARRNMAVSAIWGAFSVSPPMVF